jgi:hypothetical protein
MRESGDEVHGSSFLLLRNRFDKGQQNMSSPAKGTRSNTRGDIGLQRGKTYEEIKIKVIKVIINWYQSHNTDEVKINCITIKLIQ